MTDTSASRRRATGRSARRARDQQLEHQARAQVVRDEERLSAKTRRAMTLGQAFTAFWRHPSPWILALSLAVAVIARIVVGDYRVSDAVLPVVALALFPFVEWTIHVVVLHFKPVEVAGRVIDTRLARDHRAHHVDPRDLPLVFIPWQTFLWLMPIIAALALLAFDRTGLGLTFAVTLSALGCGYEWTHYLIHSDHRPRTRVYRAVWRNHRLHHYKNERYWFTVTTARTADRILGTGPDPSTVESSPTARDLLGTR